MRVISLRTLREFWERYPDAETPLRNWLRVVRRGRYRTPNELQTAFPYVSIVGNEVAVFNIRRNRYRLVVRVWYDGQQMYVKFVGTHEEYDKLNLREL